MFVTKRNGCKESVQFDKLMNVLQILYKDNIKLINEITTQISVFYIFKALKELMTIDNDMELSDEEEIEEYNMIMFHIYTIINNIMYNNFDSQLKINKSLSYVNEHFKSASYDVHLINNDIDNTVNILKEQLYLNTKIKQIKEINYNITINECNKHIEWVRKEIEMFSPDDVKIIENNFITKEFDYLEKLKNSKDSNEMIKNNRFVIIESLLLLDSKLNTTIHNFI